MDINFETKIEIKIGDIEFIISEFYDSWSDIKEIQIKRIGSMSFLTEREILSGTLSDELSSSSDLESELENYLDDYRMVLDKYHKLIIFK